MTFQTFPAILLMLLLLAFRPAFAEAALSCDSRFPLPQALSAARLVIYGEMHGTRETPAAVASHVCALLASGKIVHLVLEIEAGEQKRIDTFIKSEGRPQDRKALLKSPFWIGPRMQGKLMHDGRSSEAMLALIDAARRYQRLTGRIRVIAASISEASQNPDETMSVAIRDSHNRNAETFVVALMGSTHASAGRGNGGNPEYEGVGYRLRDLKPEVISVQNAGGTTWACMQGSCKKQNLGLVSTPANPPLGYTPLSSPGFNWALMFGAITSSPPAVRP